MSSNGSQQIVQRLWNYCNVLRDDGLSYGDYVEQLTYLLFLKMADEQTQPPCEPAVADPGGRTTGRACSTRDGDALEAHYRHILETLGKQQRDAGPHLPQGAEQDPGPGQAAPADRRPDRRREVDRPRRRRQGRRLRGAAGEERPGHQGRRRAVLHARGRSSGRWST